MSSVARVNCLTALLPATHPHFQSTRDLGDVDAFTRSAVDAYALAAQSAIQELCLPSLEMIVLYGSRARGNFRSDSDADVALVVRSNEHVSSGQILWEIGAKTFHVEAQFCFVISPVVIWSKFLATPSTSRNLALYEKVLREGTVWKL